MDARVAPAEPLRGFVAHHWISTGNADPAFEVLPDGAIDLVVERHGDDWQAWIYGSTTRPTSLACRLGAHYAGVRFRPGQARHLLRTGAAALTDARIDAADLLPRASLEAIAERLPHGDVAAEVDGLLLARLSAQAPRANAADELLQRIDAARGCVRLDTLFAQLGTGPRWLQRLFVDAVGVTPKFYARIARATHAAQLLAARPRVALAEAAAQAGYADQSHMTRDFAQLAGTTPRRWQAVFLQDG